MASLQSPSPVACYPCGDRATVEWFGKQCPLPLPGFVLLPNASLVDAHRDREERRDSAAALFVGEPKALPRWPGERKNICPFLSLVFYGRGKTLISLLPKILNAG